MGGKLENKVTLELTQLYRCNCKGLGSCYGYSLNVEMNHNLCYCTIHWGLSDNIMIIVLSDLRWLNIVQDCLCRGTWGYKGNLGMSVMIYVREWWHIKKNVTQLFQLPLCLRLSPQLSPPQLSSHIVHHI